VAMLGAKLVYPVNIRLGDYFVSGGLNVILHRVYFA